MTDILLVCVRWLILTMLNKYIFLCLEFNFVMSAVSGISLDYYFGFDDPLRSARNIEDCNSRRTLETCQQKCGPNHACLLGKCFCASVKPANKNDGKSNVARLTSDPRCNKLRTKLKVLDEFLEKSSSIDVQVELPSVISSQENKDNENDKYYMKLDEKALRPSLRHHIAHFCPNLDIARQCIKKCMERGKPAFCGKDHVCYCGHRYDSHHKDVPVNVNDTYTPFQDLYEKYFGPRPTESTTTTTDKIKSLLAVSVTDSSHKSNSVESESKESESMESGSQESGSEEAGSNESGSEETESEETESEEAESEEAESEEAKSEEAKSEEAKSEEAKSEEAGSKEAEPKDVASKEAGSKDVASKEAGSKENEAAESSTTDSATTANAGGESETTLPEANAET